MKYLVAIHHPVGYDGSNEDESMIREIMDLNKEMIAAGVRDFAGGLTPVDTARTIIRQPDGEVLVTDGPYMETKEMIGGFWILDVADMDEAVAWGEKAAKACRVPVEVRQFIFRPPTTKG